MKTKRAPLRFIALCYAAGLLVYLLVCGGLLLRDTLHRRAGSMPRLVLALDDLLPDESILPLDAEGYGAFAFVSLGDDPRLIYEPDAPLYVGRVVFDAEYSRPGGEITLFYTTRPGEAYSDSKKLWATLDAGGRWGFDLGGKKVYALRLDPDTTGGVLWQVDAFVLNETKPAAAYFIPDTFGIFLLLLLPALFAAAALEVARTLVPTLRRWRRGRRDKAK